jgi:hypothetical protein
MQLLSHGVRDCREPVLMALVGAVGGRARRATAATPTVGNCADSGSGSLPAAMAVPTRASVQASCGTTDVTRWMKTCRSCMYPRRKSRVLSTVTSPSSVIMPGLNWMYASGEFICGELQ